MKWDDIGVLLEYSLKRYPSPNIRWNKRKFELRCQEILAYETAIYRCMDNPFKDPIDILEDYLMYLASCKASFKRKIDRRENYMYMERVVTHLVAKSRRCSKEEKL